MWFLTINDITTMSTHTRYSSFPTFNTALFHIDRAGPVSRLPLWGKDTTGAGVRPLAVVHTGTYFPPEPWIYITPNSRSLGPLTCLRVWSTNNWRPWPLWWGVWGRNTSVSKDPLPNLYSHLYHRAPGSHYPFYDVVAFFWNQYDRERKCQDQYLLWQDN